MVSRRQKQKQSRKQKQKQSRKQKQRQSRKQRQQRGGMAPFDASSRLLDESVGRDMAQTSVLDRYMSDLSHVIPKQGGGRRRNRRSQRSRRNRNQRGGMAPIDHPTMMFKDAPGSNSQFTDENNVNSLYSQNRGAQGY